MKKIVVISILIAAGFSQLVFASAATDLKSRLDKVNSFHASFTQKITDDKNTLIQQGTGELWVKRPDLFNWHMLQPDESELISDGKTLWFYNPFVEQVTALWLKDATTDTPFMLIARNQQQDWQQYDIRRQGDVFTLTPKQPGNLQQFTISVTASGVIQQFSALEQSGQRSSYQLSKQQNSAIPMSKFSFTPPAGITLDDQRQ